MDPETLYRGGFGVVSLTVLATVLTGIIWWIRWSIVSRYSPETPVLNFTGDESNELITRTEQPKPCWTVAEAAFMFGMTLVFSSALLSLAMGSVPESKTSEPVKQALQQAGPLQTEAPAESNSNEAGIAEESDKPEEKNTAEKVSDLPLRIQVSVHFFATALALSLTLAFLYLLRHATFTTLGMVPSLADIRQGFIATPWILAPVLAINLVVSQLVKYEHAVTNMLAIENDLLTFAFLMLSAAVLTPIAEEFQFRLLLQGGLQRIADGADEDDSPTWQPRSFWPILLTSFVFAALHFGQGAAPIPLFFLSIGLGYLYQATGRLTPVIIVHMLLNGATLCMEFFRINGNIPSPGG